MRHIALLLCALFVCVFAQTDKKIVQVNLVANWQEAPLQYEISEFLKENEPKLLWNLLKDVQSDKSEDFLSYCKQHLSNEQYSLLEYALTIHYFAPKLQIQRQLHNEALASLSESLQTKAKSCSSWILINNQVACTADELNSLLSSSASSSEPLAQDTVYASNPSAPTAFFYASLDSSSSLHSTLTDLSTQGKLTYTLRYNIPNSDQKLPLAGYGVDLAIKSLEYKSVDDTKVEGSTNYDNVAIEDEEEETQGFLFGVLKKRKPELSNELSAFKAVLTGSNIQFESLKVWNLKVFGNNLGELGYQAAQRIIKGANPLKLMKDLSQNFPNHAVALSRVKVNDTLKSELQNSRLLPEGDSLALINGRVIHLETITPFELYSILQEESFKLNSLLTLKISKTDAFKVLSTAADKSPVNTFKIPTDAPIVYLNDLENDPQYQGWPRSVSELFRRVWPGSFRYIAKNLFTSVTFINVGESRSYETVSVLESVLSQNIPFRFGFVVSTLSYEQIASMVRSDPASLDTVQDSIATTIAKVFYHIKDEYGVRNSVNFLRLLSSVTDITQETIQYSLDNTLARLTSQKAKVSSIAKATTWDSQITAANKLVYQMGIDTTPSSFLNGQYIPAYDSQAILQESISVSFDQVGKLQDLVRTGQLRDNSNTFEVLMRQSNLLTHFSSLILPSNSNPLKFINLIQHPSPTKYYLMSPEDSDSTKAISHFLIVDLTRSSHIALIGDAINFLKTNPKETRIAFVFSDVGDQLLPKSIFAAMDTQLQKKSFNFIDALITEYSKDNSITRDQVLKIAADQNLNVEKFTKALDGDYSQELSRQSQYARDTKITVPSVITNGRVITLESVFTVEDWKFLGEFERKSRVNSVLDIVSMATIEGVDSESQTSDFFSDIVMSSVSIIGIDQQNNIEKYSLPSHAKISLVLSQDKPETFLVTCIINPLSIAAQRFTPILEALYSFFDVKIQLIFNPKEESNLPLKNFYQYVLPTSLSSAPTAKFPHLPTQRLLTLALDTPESWLVTPTIARYDLDNIKLEDIDDKLVFAQFELTSIIMEGNCYEYGNPPRGLELELRSSNNTRRDTIVMSNYGYFQLKANPGIWELQLKENSRSKLLYKFVGGESKMFIDSFEGVVKHVNVQKYPERMHEQLLSDDPVPDYWGSISNLWPGGKATTGGGNDSDTIHVFSLASGHLYERFLKIMMLTVTRNTKSPVKFWLLANFLSPKFKDFIPHMAKQYNFEYELVTYKWPSWLHKQTEKQRIIWGYKILFLDVLFPLDLKKVIYVDADQIVKSDLKELWNLDLQGAPYAYTPFCKDKPEMDGFKFWNQGFWANHLRGLPYHISALYVVDLVQFRKMAAGDILRSNYDQLSQDPNSLANLDQDLPNYLQHQVRIFSLPSEWLWCETWCSDGSKEAAKTIDLCNNPLTKIPKLDNAVKVIPEWTNMDNEIKALENQVLSKATDNVDQAILAMEQAQINL